ncbi:MAG: hypothetical protein GKR77_01950 [Legionellales bacterium]|nr:hypothetical protein [Legionellales bacterium]
MNLRKIVIALAALGASSTALAGTIDSTCAGDSVTVGCEQAGWQVGAKYLFVQPTGDQLYSDLSSHSKWASGFELNTAYLFGEGKDVSLNWTYFSKTSKRNVQPLDTLLTPIIDTRKNSLTNISDSAEQIKSKFSAVNLEFGQTAYWGSQVTTRLHAGLQSVSIKRARSHFDQVAQFGTENPVFASSQLNYEQTFKGIGPRVGIDSAYAIGDSNLSLVGKGAITVLAGTSKVRKNSTTLMQFTPSTPKNDIAFIETMPDQRTRTIAPALEAKLGLQYDVPLATGTMMIEAGYQWVNYLQVMKAPVNAIPDSLDVSKKTLTFEPSNSGIPGNQNNFGYHGFYAGLKWQGDLI